MRIFEIATGFTSVPAKIGAATEIVIENLINAFSSNGDSATLIDMNDSERLEINCPIIEIKMPAWAAKPASFLSIKHKLKRVLYSLKLALKVKKLLHSDPQAVFHFHNQYNFFFTYRWCFAFSKKGKQTCLVYTLHTPLWSEDLETIKKDAPKKYFMESFAIKHADIVVALNPRIAQNIIEYFRDSMKNKLQIIPNGVNTHVYHPLRTEKSIKSFINIGSVCDRKNQLTTIQLLKPILKEQSCHFYFAGAIADEPYMEKINTYIKENHLEDHITYLGEISPGEEMNQAYNKADIYISHSKSEAFSLTILEAMSAGLPLILSNSFETSINGMEATGVLKICKTETDFYDEIKLLLSDEVLLEKKKLECVSYIQQHFTWERIARKHKDIFNSFYLQ